MTYFKNRRGVYKVIDSSTPYLYSSSIPYKRKYGKLSHNSGGFRETLQYVAITIVVIACSIQLY